MRLDFIRLFAAFKCGVLPFIGYSVASFYLVAMCCEGRALGRCSRLGLFFEKLVEPRTTRGTEIHSVLSGLSSLGCQFSGGHRRGETPVSMPNTVVKPSTADGTAGAASWESRSLPGLYLPGDCR